ncbi:c-type cytochrome [Hyphomonas sp.]|uniref:c-type cytochrome n=1 Tax=Hyphomonas sp. TaxID=87 RepID=UPI00391D7D21
MTARNWAIPVLGGIGLVLAACGGSETAPAAPPAAPPPAAETVTEEPAAPETETVEAEVPTAETETAETDTAEPAATETAAAPEPTPASADGTIRGYTGDATRGRRVFAQCMTCHAVQEGRNGTGPSLYNIVGRESGTVPGFRYSQANLNSDVIWTEENLFDYLENPSRYIPGTIMVFPGLRNPQDRADVIAYLKNPA